MRKHLKIWPRHSVSQSVTISLQTYQTVQNLTKYTQMTQPNIVLQNLSENFRKSEKCLINLSKILQKSEDNLSKISSIVATLNISTEFANIVSKS